MITYICEKCGLKTNTSVCPHCGGGRSAIDKSELFWCSHCNIPTYDEVCPICGNHGKYFTSDARPVFPEERLLLEIMKVLSDEQKNWIKTIAQEYMDIEGISDLLI